MKLLTKRQFMKKIFLGCLFFFAIFFSSYAQSSDLRGTWILENVVVLKVEGIDTVAVNINAVQGDSFLGIFDKLVFIGDKVTLYAQKDNFVGEYSLKDNKIGINFLSAPILFEYQIKEDKLYLENRIEHPGHAFLSSGIYYVKAIFKK